VSTPSLSQVAARLDRVEQRLQSAENDIHRVSGQAAVVAQSHQALQQDHARAARRLTLIWNFVSALRETLIRLSEVRQ
jgi:hypothetical protein